MFPGLVTLLMHLLVSVLYILYMKMSICQAMHRGQGETSLDLNTSQENGILF